MKTMSWKAALLTTICFIAFNPIALALVSGPQVMISNLDQLWTQPGMGNFETVLPGDGYGFMFATGATPYTLNQVTLEELGGPGTVQLAVYSVQGNPNVAGNLALVGALGDAVVDPQPTQWPGYTSFIDYTPATSMALAPDTSYLIAATEPANGTDGTALTFNFNFSYAVSGDWSVDTSSSAWTYLTAPPTNPLNGWNPDNSPGSIMIEVDATPVPEPCSGLLLSLTFGLYCYRRFGRSQQIPK